MSGHYASPKCFVKLLMFKDFVSVSYCIFAGDGGNLFSSHSESWIPLKI